MNANLEKSAVNGKCPDPEALSAHFDSKQELDGETAEHVRSCEFCGRRLDEYGRLANGMKCALSSAEAEDILLRIKSGVHEKLKREGQSETRRPINFPYWLSSIAAGLAVCALGTYMVTHMERPAPEVASSLPPTPVRMMATAPSELSAPSNALASSGVAEKPKSQEPSLSDSFGAIDLKQLSSVSFGGDDGARMIAGAVDTPNRQPAVIEPSVRHVWMVQSGKDLSAQMKTIEMALSLDPKSISLSGGDNASKLSFDISRRQAVAIVRALKASGYELLSPQQPQPEQKVFSGNGEEPVRYEADFVFKR